MRKNQEELDTYIIPPNFIESGTVFGGMFRLRNVIEAGALAVAIGVPVFYLHLSLTVKIIILCLTALPAALLGLIGIYGESLSSFIIILIKFLLNRRIIGKQDAEEPILKEPRASKSSTAKTEPKQEKEPSMMAEILAVVRSRRKAGKEGRREKDKSGESVQKKSRSKPSSETACLNPVAE